MTIKLYSGAVIFLVCLLAAPSSAFAEEAYGFFACTVRKEGVRIMVHTKPVMYDFPAPPGPKDDSIESMVKHSFAERKAFSDARTDDLERFLTETERHYDESCRIDGYIYTHGPFGTHEEALEAVTFHTNMGQANANAFEGEFRVEILEFE